MVIILAWIIRSGHKYDRAVRRYAGIVFRAGIIGRLKTVTQLQLN